MKSIKLSLLTMIAALAFNTTSYSQDFGKKIYKKYIQNDSLSIHKSSVLVFYKDETFLNYGILKDERNNEEYLWYTFGKWSLNKDKQISCRTLFDSFNQKKVIDKIKSNYKTRPDYNEIESSYAFINEHYSDYSILLIKKKAVDPEKRIEYQEVLLNNSKNKM